MTKEALPIANASTIGAFGNVVPWTSIPLHAALLPDGRVMSYGTKQDGTQTGKFNYDVRTPSEGTALSAHLDLPNTAGTDLFCSSQMVLQSGDVLLNGGDIYDPNFGAGQSTNVGSADVNLFSPSSNTIQRLGSMNRPRWYGTPTTLPDGRIYIQGGQGGNDRPKSAGTAASTAC